MEQGPSLLWIMELNRNGAAQLLFCACSNKIWGVYRMYYIHTPTHYVSYLLLLLLLNWVRATPDRPFAHSFLLRCSQSVAQLWWTVHHGAAHTTTAGLTDHMPGMRVLLFDSSRYAAVSHVTGHLLAG
jgi:hypothetical protein